LLSNNNVFLGGGTLSEMVGGAGVLARKWGTGGGSGGGGEGANRTRDILIIIIHKTNK